MTVKFIPPIASILSIDTLYQEISKIPQKYSIQQLPNRAIYLSIYIQLILIEHEGSMLHIP